MTSLKTLCILYQTTHVRQCLFRILAGTMSHTLLTAKSQALSVQRIMGRGGPLKEVSPGHFVSEEQVANWFRIV